MFVRSPGRQIVPNILRSLLSIRVYELKDNRKLLIFPEARSGSRNRFVAQYVSSEKEWGKAVTTLTQLWRCFRDKPVEMTSSITRLPKFRQYHRRSSYLLVPWLKCLRDRGWAKLLNPRSPHDTDSVAHPISKAYSFPLCLSNGYQRPSPGAIPETWYARMSWNIDLAVP